MITLQRGEKYFLNMRVEEMKYYTSVDSYHTNSMVTFSAHTRYSKNLL